MPVIENIQRQDQTSLGNLTPHADQRRFGSGWAVVSGNHPSGSYSVDAYKIGIPRGENHEIRIPYEEYKDEKGNPHETVVGGTRFREMITDRESLRIADQLEAKQSSARVKRELERKFEDMGNGVSRNATYEFESTAVSVTMPPEFQQTKPRRTRRSRKADAPAPPE